MLKVYGILASVVLIMSGCALFGPRYETRYTYEEPKTQAERNCIVTCKTAKNSCDQLCKSDYQRCQDANERYEDEKKMCEAAVKRGERKAYDCPTFSRSKSCTQICGCTEQYVDCYRTCGLEVTSREVCVSNCK